MDGGVVYVNATFDSPYGNNGYNYTNIDVVGSPSGMIQDVICGVPFKVVITAPPDGSIEMSGVPFTATYEIQDRDSMIAQGYFTFGDGPMEWFSSDPSFVAPGARTFNGTADANPGSHNESLTLNTPPSQWINVSEGGSGESNPYLTPWGQFYIDPDETLAGWLEDWDIITLNLI